MSALPPKADIAERDWYGRFVPKAEITNCYNRTASAVTVGGNFGNCVNRRGSLSSPSVWLRRGLRDRERHRLPALRAPSEYVVVSIDQFDKHLVLTGRQTSHADCIVVTRRFHPTPRQVVDVDIGLHNRPGRQQWKERLAESRARVSSPLLD